MHGGEAADAAETRCRPTICLNMIVRDEAHVVAEALACVARHIDRWVIVDTGSVDGTIELIRSFFAERGIPGELHERRWVDFGTNRTEALDLAAGQADYTWVIDADDLVEGELDLTGLDADAYTLRYGRDAFTFWRTQTSGPRCPGASRAWSTSTRRATRRRPGLPTRPLPTCSRS